MRRLRLACVLIISVVLCMMSPPSAVAVPPSNDEIAGAIEVFTNTRTTIDTSEASADDPSVAVEGCTTEGDGIVFDASVWFKYTPTTSEEVVISTFGSDYSARLLIATGSPGNLTGLICFPTQAHTFTAEAGVTYYILAYDNQEDGSGNGGMLNLIVETTVLPQSDLRIESAELDPQNRTITLSGTFTCEQDSTFRLEAIVRQSKSKVTAESEPLMYTAVCNGGIDEQEWQVSGKASSGFFRPGAATVSITWTTCRISYCTFSGTDAPIRIAVG